MDKDKELQRESSSSIDQLKKLYEEERKTREERF